MISLCSPDGCECEIVTCDDVIRTEVELSIRASLPDKKHEMGDEGNVPGGDTWLR